MSQSVAAFGLAASLSFIFTYIARAYGLRVGWVDVPDGKRRCHPHPVPRVGGVAIYAGVAATLGFYFAVQGIDFPMVPTGALPFLLALAVGGAAIFALGLWDDLRELNAGTKFIVELLIAGGVYGLGVRIETLGLPHGDVLVLPTWVSLPLTLLWIVGITNAFNLIDGSDGVAAGAALFASGSIAFASLLLGNDLAAVIALVVAGATLGFLFFNFPPASIFLGDSGSLFLGFMLATLGIASTQKATTALAVAIPIVAFGLPILDTLLAIVRRFLRGERIFRPDRGHIHHRLSELGHSPRSIALLLYIACAALALLSLLLTQPTGRTVAAVFLLAGAAVAVAVGRLRIPEILELGGILARALRQRRVISHNVRIRNASAQMRVAEDPDEVLAALMDAFHSSEFARAEVWLHEDFGSLLDGRGTKGRNRERLWSWSAATHGKEDFWELRLPLWDGEGHLIGRLSLWRPVAGGNLLTDLQLIAESLRRELQSALMRLRDRSASSSAVPSTQDVLETLQ